VPLAPRSYYQRALELAIAAAGAAFLALGLRGWTRIAWGNDTTGARTPVRYGTLLRLPAELDTLHPDVKWTIIVTGTQAAQACRQLLDGDRPEHRRPLALLVVTEGDSADLSLCLPRASLGRSEVPRARVRLALGTPARGFLITDRTGRVVYGSFERGYLKRALSSLAEVD